MASANPTRYYSVNFNSGRVGGVAYSDFEKYYLPHEGIIASWTPLEMELRDAGYTDYLANDQGFRLCSERLRAVLDEHRSPHDEVQWLGVTVSRGPRREPYFILYFPNPPDVLDRDRTVYDDAAKQSVMRPVFSAQLLARHNILCLPHKGGGLRLYVSEKVRNAIIAARCTGVSWSPAPVSEAPVEPERLAHSSAQPQIVVVAPPLKMGSCRASSPRRGLFQLQSELAPLLVTGDLAACERKAKEWLRALPPSPFHIAGEATITNRPQKVAAHFDAFFRREQLRFPVRAAYAEMNAFMANTDLWFFDVFAYDAYGGEDNYDWLSDWRSEEYAAVPLTGMETLQAAFAGQVGRAKEFAEACDVATLLVIIKFQGLILSAAHHMRELRFPLLSTAHDFDFIYEVRRNAPPD